MKFVKIKKNFIAKNEILKTKNKNLKYIHKPFMSVKIY